MNELNKSYKREGYWEHYFSENKVSSKGYYKSGKRIGCWEEYSLNNKIKTKEFYL